MASAEEWSYRGQKTTTQRPPPTHSPQPGPSAPHTQRTHPQNWSHNRTEEPHKHIPNQPPYPPLPPPPRHPPPPHPWREDLSGTDSDGRRSDHHTGNERDRYKGSPLNNERDDYKGSPLDHHTRTSDTKGESPDTSKNPTKPGQTVIKEFKSKTVPRFVPRQVRGRSKPLIKKHLLVKPPPAPADSVPALETDSQSEDAGQKAESWVPPRERDSVNAALKAESCVLRDVHGPRLPEPEEAKREAFKSSETGDESVDETVAAIRKRVHEVIFPLTFLSMSFPNSKKYVTYLEVRLLSMRLSRLFI